MHDVIDKSLEDRMESFFLSETVKYLYLTFDKDNYLNRQGETEYVFTTEGNFYPIKEAFKFKNKKNKAKSRKKFKTVRRLLKNETDCEYSNVCNLTMPLSDYYNMRFNLPMKIKYFEQLFDMVGEENLEKLLERKLGK